MSLTKKYNKILLKLSGEFLSGNNSTIGIESLNYIYEEIKKIVDYKVGVGIVIGGGNILRGSHQRQEKYFKDFRFSQVSADKAGMLSTVINGIILADFLNQKGLKTKVMSNIFIDFVQFFEAEIAKNYIQNGYILIFTAGTGNPFVSTDTAAVIKALEIEADILLKATNVDGVYNKDPKKFKDAVLFDKLSFEYALENKLKVMDLSAFSLAMENNLPIIVFNFLKSDNLLKIIKGENIGTIVSN